MTDVVIYNPEWENVSQNTYRLAVPGGWLVKDIYTLIHADRTCSVAIGQWKVEDEFHDKWKLKNR